jgi:BirA family biotin operon repressor/biotin-[acetyl-CoA-carboxylase] ligase
MIIANIVHRLETCASTNDAAREFARDGFEEGLVVLADAQQAGRGTHGRSWFSPAGKGLYLSVVLRPEAGRSALIPLVGGLAVRDAIREVTGLEARLKWPNDVTIEGRKVAGVLSEASFTGTHLNFVILGLGLNVSHGPDDFPPDLRETAGSLLLAAGRAPSPEAVLARLYPALDRWYDGLRTGRVGEILRAAESALGLRPGSSVSLTTEAGAVCGEFVELRPDGGIVLEGRDGRRVLGPAEVLAIAAG